VAQLSVAAVVLVPVGVWALRKDPVYLLCGLCPALLISAIVLTTTGSYPFWHLPLLSALAIAAGTAIPELRRLARRLVPVARGVVRGSMVVAAGLLAAGGLTGAAGGAVYIADHGADASRWARGVLTALPRGAQVVAPWSAYAALRATQELEHRRGDVTVTLAHHWPTDAADLRRARGYLVGMDVGATPVPSGWRLVRVGPQGVVDRKGITGLSFAGRLLGDLQYKAQAYLVERSNAGVGARAYNR
jgi:hypothetical protein